MAMKNPPHPGRLVKSDIEALALSITQAAEAMEVSRSQLNRVISGDSAISPEMAVRLEAVIGGNADHWLRMQSAYDLAQVKNSADNPAKGLKRLFASDHLPSEQPNPI